jgi:hypothetical protein
MSLVCTSTHLLEVPGVWNFELLGDAKWKQNKNTYPADERENACVYNKDFHKLRIGYLKQISISLLIND